MLMGRPAGNAVLPCDRETENRKLWRQELVKMKLWLVLVAAATFCGLAEGAVLGTATLERNPPGLPFSAPDGDLSSPWVAYSLSLQSTTSTKIAALDVRIKGPLHQRWVYNDSTATFDPTPNGVEMSSGDSHLLAPVNNTLLVIGPSEDNSGVGSPLADTASSDYGIGSMLHGVWGYVSASHSTSHTFAYIVVPRGQLSALDIEVQSASGAGEIFNTLTERDFFPNVPEPTSSVLLGVGLIIGGLLARRRQHDRGLHLAKFAGGVLFTAIIALASGSASAGVIPTLTLIKDPGNGVPFTAPDAALGSPWVSYAIGLQSTAGELIGGIDFEITGPLHQRWTYDEDSETYVPTANSANQSNGDSHVRAPSGALFGFGPTEDNSGVGSPLADTATSNYGLGSYLKGSWGITNATTTASVAYIVVPKDQTGVINFRATVANPAGDIIARLSTCSFTFCSTQMYVSGKGVPISDGDTSPSLLDDTDFGSVLPFPPFNQDANRTFTITASGDSALELGTPVFSGPFSILGDFPSLIPAGSSASFKVQLNPDVLFGNHYGTISIPNSSINAPVFDFSLHAAVPEPASGVLFGLGALGIVSVVFSRERLG
jgi:hypothetical protein